MRSAVTLALVPVLGAIAISIGMPPILPHSTSAELERGKSSVVYRAPVNRFITFEGLASIKILQQASSNEGQLTERTLTGGRKSTFNFDLELGESIENQLIVLQPFPNDAREFKVEQQFETSMAIGDEGPHVDLINWKHYTSDWKEIENVGENRFRTFRVSEADTQRFPAATSQEIHRVVLKEGGKRWGDLARQCKTPFDPPCYVGLSRISFRISAYEDGNWNEIHRINFSIPLGC